jgi:uncharacterized protein YabE (DUF348 family)
VRVRRQRGRHAAPRRPADAPRRSPRVLALFVLAFFVLGGGAVAYATLDRTFVVVVDGQRDVVHSFSGTVAAVLVDGGIHTGVHDQVTPPLTADVRAGSTIVIERARQLLLTVGAAHYQVWTTRSTVGAALDALGLRVPGEYVSAADSDHVPLSGLHLAIRLPQQVTVLVDDHRILATTTAPTVAALLGQLRITLARTDLVDVPLSSYPTTGTVVEVIRVRAHLWTENVATSYRVRRLDTDALFVGEQRVLLPGAPGVRRLLYRVTLNDGRVFSRVLLAASLVLPPRTEVVEIGTRPSPASSLNWAALAMCESGDNPRAVSSDGLYMGLYQFDYTSWYWVGGAGSPLDASPAEQLYRAQLLYERAGAGSWPICGHLLFT